MDLKYRDLVLVTIPNVLIKSEYILTRNKTFSGTRMQMAVNNHTDQYGYADAGLFDNALVLITVLDIQMNIITKKHGRRS